MGVTDLDEEIVRNAVDFSRFDNMKRMERKRRFENARLQVRDEADPESNKVRKGKVGGHADYLSPEDLAHCNDVIAELDVRWRMRRASHAVRRLRTTRGVGVQPDVGFQIGERSDIRDSRGRVFE